MRWNTTSGTRSTCWGSLPWYTNHCTELCINFCCNVIGSLHCCVCRLLHLRCCCGCNADCWGLWLYALMRFLRGQLLGLYSRLCDSPFQDRLCDCPLRGVSREGVLLAVV